MQTVQFVSYTLNQDDAEVVNRRRADGERNRLGRAQHAANTAVHTGEDARAGDVLSPTETGVVVHVGNRVSAGDVFPMLIVRRWGSTPESAVNGQVFLDGNDTLWVTSVTPGPGERQFVA